MKKYLLFFAVISMMIQVANGQVSRYVTNTGAGTKTGVSWANAYDKTQLQTAINEATVTQVWVAAGTYKPTTGTDRTISFSMKNGVAIYGGFAGTETSLSQRNWKTNVTILSGDIGTPGDNTDNSYHVIYNNGLSNTAILDGFTINGGKADNNASGNTSGGGVLNSSSSPKLTNCIIADNSASNYGGGLSNDRSSPILTNCLLKGNSAMAGGGMYNYINSSAILINCTITGNSASFGGGGIYNYSSVPTFKNSIIWGNTAKSSGNQIYSSSYSGTTLNSSCYSNGTNDYFSEGINVLTPDAFCITTNPKFYNPNNDFRITAVSPCADAGNDSYNSETTDIRGAGFGRKLSKIDATTGTIDMGAYEFKKGADPETPMPMIIYVKADAVGANNGTSWANAYKSLQTALTAASSYYEIWVAAGTYKPTASTDRGISFQMKNDVAIYGGFTGTETLLSQRNWKTNIAILSGDLNGDDVVTGTGATLSITGNTENSYHVFYHPSSLALTSTAILDGFTIKGGYAIDANNMTLGGGIYNEASSPTIANCTISGNSATVGGGVDNESFSSPTITNCIISGNSGGGVSIQQSSPVLTNCLISNNSGSGIYAYGIYSNSTLINCTITNNYANSGGGIYTYSAGLTINNSIIWGNTATSTGNQFYNVNGGATLNFSCYSNETNDFSGYFSATNNNITTYPKFINPNNDFRLAVASPCLDAGSNSYNSELTDIRGPGFGRKLLKTNAAATGTIDMGAYEFKKGTDPEVPELLRIFVKVNASGLNNGKTWTDAYTSLQSALNAAGRYYEIWVATGTYKPTTDGDRSISFSMKKDMAIYGGFAGTETLLSQRDWKTNVTILSGDLNDDDVVTGNGETLAITGNTENSYHVLYNAGSLTSTAIFDGFTIQGGSANDGSWNYPNYYGGGILNASSSPTLANLTFTGNFGYNGGAICNLSSSPTMSNCKFIDNKAHYDGGGIFNISSSPILTNCVFENNYVSNNGAGISNSSSSPILNNCLIINNAGAAYGSGLSNVSSSSPTLTNCTISGNSSRFYGGGIYNQNSSSPILNNSIIWGNSATSGGNQIYIGDGTTTLNYSCYANGTGDISNAGILTPTNCITTYPKFVNPNTDFRLTAASPCADTGNDDYNNEVSDIRGPGFGRKLLKTNAAAAGTIDMGAYEFKKGTDPEVPDLLRICVKAGASGLNNGKNWTDAYTSLQSALAAAGRYYEIWVAAGTYKPTTDNNRYISFNMKQAVTIYGGFAGTETLLSQRNWKTNLTILSGDIGTTGDNTDNTYHVIYNTGIGSSAILDGFTIQGGNANDGTYGGGISNESSSPSLVNLTITENFSSTGGGGMYNSLSSPALTNCLIRNNSGSSYGGGIFNINSSPALTNCGISGNSAIIGGGVDNANSCLPLFTNCTISENTASIGGGVTNRAGSSPTFINCTISGNSASQGGGFYNNSSSSPILNNSIIWGNTATSDNQIYMENGTTTLNYSCYANGIGDISNTGTLTTTNCITTNPQFVNSNNDFRIVNTSPCADAGLNSYNSELTDIRGTGFGRTLLKSDYTQQGNIDLGAYEFKQGTDPGNPTNGGLISGASSVCNGSAHPGITSTALPTGHVGTLEYKWQMSTTSGSSGFADIASSNTATYNPGVMTVATWFKRLARIDIMTDWIGAAESNVLQVKIDPVTVGGSVTGSAFVCSGINSTPLTLSGQTGTILKWQKSTDNWSTFSDISNTTNTLTATNITTTTKFRAVVQSGICSIVSSVDAMVTVNPLPVPTITGLATACTGTTGVTYTTESGMTGYTWIVSAGGTITSGASTNAITVSWNTAGAQTVSVNYANANSCSAATATVKSVTINPLPNPTITGLATACAGTTGVTYTTESGMTGYNWTVSAGGTITSSSSTNAITVSWNTAGAQTVSVNYANANSCSAATATVKNVTVNPLPNPTITGLATACTGTTGVTYTTESGMTGYTWIVSAGGTITSGASTNAITVSWNTAGAQTVSVNYANANSCSAATATVKSVTINPLPNPTITGLATACAGTTGVTYTTESGMTGYNWTVSAGGTITSSSSTNAITVSWNTAGAQTVSVNYANANSCSAATATVKNVTVNPLPNPTITGLATACAGTTGVTYTTESGMTGYNWTVSAGGTITSSSSTNAITVSWNTAGAQTVSVNYANANSCSAATATVKIVTVNPLPNPTITGLATACAGTTGVTYTTESGMTGYNWTVSAGGTITSSSSTNAITVSWNTAGAQTVSVNYANANSCSAATATVKIVTINPLPNPTITGLATACAGTTGVTYTTESGMTGYNWTVSAGGTITSSSSTNAITVSWNTAGAQTVSVNYANANSCSAATATVKNVMVIASPNTSAIAGKQTPGCNESGVNYSVSLTTGSSYTWTVPSGAIITSGATGPNNNQITVSFGSTNGDITVVETNANTCSGTTKKLSINLVGCGLNADFTGTPLTVCQGSAVIFSNTSTGTTGSTIYSWNFGTGATPATASSSGPHVVTYSTSGQKTVSLTITDGASKTETKTNYISVSSLPMPSISGLATACAGTTGVTYTTESGMTGYNWTVSAGGTITSSSSANTITVSWNTAGAQTVSVNYANANSCSAATATVKSVTVNPLPNPLITGPATACAGTTGLTYTTESGMTGYNWTVSAGGTITSSSTTNTITVSWNTAGAQTVSVNYANANSCSAATATMKSVTINPLPNPTITGLATACAGTTGVTYTTESGMTGYNWTVSAGGTITSSSSTNAITVSWNTAGAQTVSVNYANANSCSAATATVKSITVIASPNTSAIAGKQTPGCNESGVTYSVSLTSGSSYAWTVPSGAIITSGATGPNNNHITVSFGSTNGDITVVETNANSCSGTTKRLSINLVGCGLNADFSGTPLTVCQGSTVTFTNTSTGTTGSTIYSWDFGTGATPAKASTSGPHNVSYSTSGQKTVSLAITDGASKTETKTNYITVNSNVTITAFSPASSTRCQGAGIVTTTTTATNNSAAIVYSLDEVSLAGGNTINSSTGAVTYSAGWSGPTTITARANGCSGPATTTHVVTTTTTLSPSVKIALTSGSNPTCSGSSVTFTATPINGGTTPSYQWKKGSTNVGTNSATYTDDAKAAGSISVVMTTSLDCATSPTATSNVIDLSVNSSGQWLGFSSDWNTASNWCGGVPTSSTNVSIPSGVNQPVIGVSISASCNDIAIADGATLTIKSDATGTGSLIISGTVSGEGSAMVQRYMTTNAWHIVASPVSGQTIDNFLATNPNVAADGSGARGMMDYDPGLNVWNEYFTDGTNGTNELETGKGFSMRTYADIEVTFNGKLQYGDLTVTGLAPTLWNCIGNPYSSAIAINANSTNGSDDFLNENAIVSQNLDPSYSAIYVWDRPDASNGVSNEYTIISNTPVFGTDAAFDVQQGQAFMVKMNTLATSIDFNSNMQFHGPALPLKSTNGIWSIVNLNASISNQKSSTTIAFNNGMTKGLDPTYDAGLLRGGSDLVLYSKLVEDNGIPFAIQALPGDDFSNLIIPIGIESKTGGEVVFSSEIMNLPSTCQLILEDKVNKTFTDLSINEYVTTLAANSSGSDRFRIHTSYVTTKLGNGAMLDNLSAYAVRNVEIRVKGKVSKEAIATLYDLQGRTVMVKTLEEGSLNIIQTPNIKTAVYMLSIQDNGKTASFKIPVNE